MATDEEYLKADALYWGDETEDEGGTTNDIPAKPPETVIIGGARDYDYNLSNLSGSERSVTGGMGGGGAIRSGNVGAGAGKRAATISASKGITPPVLNSGPAPQFKPPELPTLPTFQLPEYPTLPEFKVDEAQVGKRAQELSGATLREIRRGLSQTTSGLDLNNPAQRKALTDALAVHGTNIERAVSGARSSARQEVGQETQINWQTEVTSLKDKYQGKLYVSQAQYQNDLEQIKTRYANDYKVAAELYNIEVANKRQMETEQLQLFNLAWKQWLSGTSVTFTA